MRKKTLYQQAYDYTPPHIPTDLEQLDEIQPVLSNICDNADRCFDLFNDARNVPSIGDFIKAEVGWPALIRYQYDSDKLAQGYRVGPLVVLRLRHDSEQAVLFWNDADEELEAEMPESSLIPLRKLRDALYEMEHDNFLDLEFEVPQDLIDGLTPDDNPFILKTGTMRSLTRSTGIPLPEEILVALSAYENAYYWRIQFKKMVRDTAKARTALFNTFNPRIAHEQRTPTAPTIQDGISKQDKLKTQFPKSTTPAWKQPKQSEI